jgi:hypothetical protein
MCGSRPGPTGRSPASSELHPANAPVHRSGGGIGRALLRGPTRRGRGHTGLEQAARRGPADDPLADPNATRFYERGADRRVALGRRCPAACSRGVTLTSGVTGSADPNIKQAFGRVGELADPVIIVPPSVRTTRFTSQLKWRASAGFPDQAKKFPDGPIQFPARPN